jgi:hypothetical protein
LHFIQRLALILKKSVCVVHWRSTVNDMQFKITSCKSVSGEAGREQFIWDYTSLIANKFIWHSDIRFKFIHVLWSVNFISKIDNDTFIQELHGKRNSMRIFCFVVGIASCCFTFGWISYLNISIMWAVTIIITAHQKIMVYQGDIVWVQQRN